MPATRQDCPFALSEILRQAMAGAFPLTALEALIDRLEAPRCPQTEVPLPAPWTRAAAPLRDARGLTEADRWPGSPAQAS